MRVILHRAPARPSGGSLSPRTGWPSS